MKVNIYIGTTRLFTKGGGGEFYVRYINVMRRITYFTNCPCKSEFSQSPGRGASAPPPLLP